LAVQKIYSAEFGREWIYETLQKDSASMYSPPVFLYQPGKRRTRGEASRLTRGECTRGESSHTRRALIGGWLCRSHRARAAAATTRRRWKAPMQSSRCGGCRRSSVLAPSPGLTLPYSGCNGCCRPAEAGLGLHCRSEFGPRANC
jgi:hypothetical protein